jgi:4-oxalocrotonate tautomerase
MTMPVVTVEWVEGRSKEQRSKVAEAITEAISTIGGAKPEATYVVFKDVPKENWASGGTLLSDK